MVWESATTFDLRVAPSELALFLPDGTVLPTFDLSNRCFRQLKVFHMSSISSIRPSGILDVQHAWVD